MPPCGRPGNQSFGGKRTKKITRDEDGWTPLYCAALHGDAEAIAALSDAGAAPNARDENGRTPFDMIPDDSPLVGTSAYRRLRNARHQRPQRRSTGLSAPLRGTSGKSPPLGCLHALKTAPAALQRQAGRKRRDRAGSRSGESPPDIPLAVPPVKRWPVLRGTASPLTDRGTEYCGKVENHAYQLYLAVEDMDHTRTRANSPQTNGICERFHRTIKDEFYDIAFRKKLYRSVEELQVDLDACPAVQRTAATFGKTLLWQNTYADLPRNVTNSRG